MNTAAAPSERYSADTAAWPARPWIWAALGAIILFAVERILDHNDDAIINQVAVVFLIASGLAFAITAERLRLGWAIGFALGAGAILALVGWFTASYNKGGEMAEYPFFAGVFAMLVAAPLFQVVRDEGGLKFPYARLHNHVWTDAVIGAASFAFVGICFALAYLIASLFKLIGITLFYDLLNYGWFSAMLGGAAFGGAFGLLRERDALVGTLQKLVLLILSVLAPVLAVALVGFLLSLPFTGLAKLWESSIPTTPTLLLAAAGAVGLINAVIGDATTDGSRNRVLRYSAFILSATILPLAIVAAISMGVRIDQYGWTPGRLWGLIAIIVATVYGLAYLFAALKNARARVPLNWDEDVRPANIRIAIAICGLALFLALPILDFGSISAKDQVARLKAKAIEIEKFDWRAMAFDFGPKGRSMLETLSKTGTAEQKTAALAALKADNKWDVEEQARAEVMLPQFDRFATISGTGPVLDDDLKRMILENRFCTGSRCHIVRESENHVIVLGTRSYGNETPTIDANAKVAAVAEPDFLETEHYRRKAYKDSQGFAGDGAGKPKPDDMVWERSSDYAEVNDTQRVNLNPASKVEIRDVTRQQVFVDGKPVSNIFKK